MNLQFLLAFPEYKVPLPGGSRSSQNDIFVLGRTDDHLVSITVEGKVDETFGPILEEWQVDESKGKKGRLAYLKSKLGLVQNIPGSIRYQLLHRTASAVIEAERFHAKSAIMLVHSFSQDNAGYEDYQAFLSLYDIDADMGKLFFLKEINGIGLYSGWVNGDLKYLEC